jgi:hypothetical protein
MEIYFKIYHIMQHLRIIPYLLYVYLVHIIISNVTNYEYFAICGQLCYESLRHIYPDFEAVIEIQFKIEAYWQKSSNCNNITI